MDKEYNMYNNFWKLVTAILITITLATTWYHTNQNKLWYASWDKCVEAGGQPMEDTVQGSDVLTFTCVRK